MAMIRVNYWICILLSSILAFTPIGIYLVPVILIYMGVLTVRTIPLCIAWFNGSYGNLILQCITNIIFAIFLYAILFIKSGLILNGQLQAIDLSTALYFSGTTWTTVGYGDISAPAELRLLTTVEALNGYFSMAILIALVGLWLNDSLNSAKQYANWIRNASRHASDLEAENDVDELSTKIHGK